MLPKKRPPTHPGEMLLKEFLEPLGVTQKMFAAHLADGPMHVSMRSSTVVVR